MSLIGHRVQGEKYMALIQISRKIKYLNALIQDVQNKNKAYNSSHDNSGLNCKWYMLLKLGESQGFMCINVYACMHVYTHRGMYAHMEHTPMEGQADKTKWHRNSGNGAQKTDLYSEHHWEEYLWF